ncbi:MAG: ABC transporter ATP-binding protein, partial [Oscillospiraceae bacterium]|nr:ABC transporter ATP-binding protein [Oscillospiraceae bacterium]
VIADEAVSALDVSIQSQVINLFKELQDQLGLTYLFISHNLSVVKYISDRIGVMYLGEMVELAETEELFRNPCHPYTKSLLSAIPLADVSEKEEERRRNRIVLQGDVPSPADPPSGCRFHTRCPMAKEICSQVKPVTREIAPGHSTCCHLYGEGV